MPFPFESSKEPVRTRRSKDKDSRSTTSSSSNKKSKHSSGSSSRSTPQDRGAHSSLYTQQNLTLDQLPALPESGTASPGSASSPILRATSVVSQPQDHPAPVFPHHTPAALRQYLDTDDVVTPRSEIAPQPQPSAEHGPRDSADLQRLQSKDNKPLDSNAATPLAKNTQGYQPPSREHSISPNLFGQPLELYRSSSSRTSSSRRTETASYSASSPPPQSVSPSVRSYTGPRSPDLALHQPQFHPQPGYVASPPPFAPSIPYHSSASNESYYQVPYATSHYLPTTNTGGHVDMQSVPQQTIPNYSNCPPPHQPQGYFNHLQYQPGRVPVSQSSRMSVPGEFPMSQAAQGSPASDSPGMARTGNDDDAADLLQRISGAIPDITALLTRYKETSGQLGDRESKLQETEAQKSEAVRQREITIKELGKELDKLRFEVGNKEEKQKELEETLAVAKQSMHDLQASHQTELARKEKEWEESKVSIECEFTSREQKVQETFASKEKDLQEQIHRQSKDTEQRKVHAQAMEALEASHNRREKEQDARHARDMEDLNNKLDQKKRHYEERRKVFEEEKASWAKERKMLEEQWEKERDDLIRQGSEEEQGVLNGKHSNDMSTLQKKHEAEIDRIRQETENEKARLRQEMINLKADWDADRLSFARKGQELRDLTSKLSVENNRLQILANTFGEVTDLKPREDDYYVDAFGDLKRQISDLAEQHFRIPPARIPREEMDMIPPEIPPFFDNTESAMHIRAAYVKHHISSLLTRHIFQPFLFVLEPRLAPADQLFREMSEELKRKSTKREALWRQRTLYAAFTASSAKQTINKVATRIVDEIMRTIKYFTPEIRWPLLIVAVRRIVKQAAETWRYARLELGMISASMDGKDIIRALTKCAGDSATNDARIEESCEKMLLPLFPAIKRDPMIGDLLGKPDLHDEGYTFSPGQILYSDNPDVVACRERIIKYNTRSTQPRVSTKRNSKQPSTQAQEIQEKPSRDSTTKGVRSRTQEQKRDVDTIHESSKSRTKPRARSHEQGEGEKDESFRDSATRRADVTEQDDRIEGSSKPSSPTRHHGTPASDDRVPSSPVELHHHDRATLSLEALEERYPAERDSRTATPAQEHGANMATPDDGPAASDHSVSSSKLTEASQHSSQSVKGTVTAPSWNNTGGEVAAFQSVGEGW